MFKVIKYTTENNNCPVDNFLNEISKDKNSLKLLTKIMVYVNMLEAYGPNINKSFKAEASKLVDAKNGIYELRPNSARVFYFFEDADQNYILLHGFIKKRIEMKKKFKRQ